MDSQLRALTRRLRRQLRPLSAAAAPRNAPDWAEELADQIVLSRVATGQLLSATIGAAAQTFTNAEFRVFSQNGEDGLIDFLVRRCIISPETFVEIGVGSYDEANTRFLAEHRRWSGVIVDSNPLLTVDLARTKLHWRSQVRALSAFVTRENIRTLLAPLLSTDQIGLLSIDIDGVDFWILEELVELKPAMLIVEYNALFGACAAVSVPYDPEFDRTRPEFHNIYYGASLAAFAHLLEGRGYALVGCVDSGANAFFVHTSRLNGVATETVEAGYRPPRFVEHRDLSGALTFNADRAAQLSDIMGLPLVDVVDGRTLTVADLL